MPAGKMHLDEAPTGVALVRRLLAAQFPHWAGLPLEPVASAGTDNALYRLGREMAVRLPRVPTAARQVDTEHKWLPRLAPHLPLAIPLPLALGAPAPGYPYRWSIYRWLEGEDATSAHFADLNETARDLARFIIALRQFAPADDAPLGRGLHLAERATGTRSAIIALRDSAALSAVVDTEAAAALWGACLQTPAWEEPPAWMHGDLIPPNLLVEQGRLSAVIDFGAFGVGDPACDLIPAWSVFDAHSREVFRAALDVDDASWARGRGWALSQALNIIPYYQHTNPVLVEVARRMIGEILTG